MKPTVVSLFSGGGGLDLGFKAQGYKIIWAIDNELNAVETYKRNIGDHIIHADINTINPLDIPKADIVIGGPPCQSFSLIGKRNTEDSRGRLVWTYIEILKAVQPKVFVFENVTGLLSAKNSKGKLIVELLKKEFKKIGYTAEMKVLDAADYGVPQHRKRVIIVGMQNGGLFVFPKASHGKGLKKYVSVLDALGDLPPSTKSGIAKYKTEARTDFQKKMRKKGGLVVTDHSTPNMSDLDKYIISHVKPGGNYMDIPSTVNSARIKRLQKEGGHTTCYGRMDPDKPSYTINTFFNRPNVGCNIHYKADRLITVREALRLQSFPDDYELVSSSKQGKHTIVGNAVPPFLAGVIAKELKKYL